MKVPSDRLLIPPVSPASPCPLYEQIVEGVKKEISEGRLKPGQPLPSFRALAEGLLVSLITVKRAYEELERQGILYSKQGLGTFIAEAGIERHREVKRAEAERLMRESLAAALHAGMSEREVLDLTRELFQQHRRGMKS